MTEFGLDYPALLMLAPFALAPALFSALRPTEISSIEAAPGDSLSRGVELGLKICGIVAIAASLIGAAAPFRAGKEFKREGTGAQIVFLIDRSGSMNETFAGRTPSGGEESKASAAKRLLQGFVDRRRHDLVGVAGFSTAPMLLMPMSDHHAAIKAAIDAVDREGLDYTNIGRGLAMALSLFKEGASDRSRAILLVSDGAGVIDPRIQLDLRAEFKKVNASLYWLFLRTAGRPGISDVPEAGDDTPQAAPERHLNMFFKTLGVPYRAFEAEGPDAITDAISKIDRLERHPARYVEKQPHESISAIFFSIALGATLFLVIAKLCETRLTAQGRAT
jgi:mxaC protein